MIHKNRQLNIKLSDAELSQLKGKIKKFRFSTISEYARFVLLNSEIQVKVK